MPIDWKGDIVFSDSVAIFRGHVGENKAHGHWASQLTIALDGDLAFETTAGWMQAKAVYLTSRTRHRLQPGPLVCSIYFDPLCGSILKALDNPAPPAWLALSRDELPPPLASLSADTDLRALLNSEVLATSDRTLAGDERFKAVIEAIKAGLGDGEDIDRKRLAAVANLSPTRFSHWFVEHAGVPVRSYKKWLKLRVAMDALLNGTSPVEAAMDAGFSDLAHMCRAFAESFGLTYLDALKALQQSTRY
ncbi:AraC-like DNA-binding protein [Fluviicoccus keumensis]|uniref:AraC-like DNA-binding protein n=1 Tax=Fluviicoccus keumensis TaxID=1435465 RepID=A0A4Q7ZD37_9GAMM|nr:helix-turn-helix domain-containing protein [Fluviicoccus keumensis]RZU47925.1 AraC-like DNA-binding protein [Fluviicoccus keumensis]